MLPKVATSCHELPQVSKHCQKLPKVARSCQRLLQVAKSCQKLPAVARSCQKLPKVFNICNKLQKVSTSCQKLPQVATIWQKLPQVAKTCQILATASTRCKVRIGSWTIFTNISKTIHRWGGLSGKAQMRQAKPLNTTARNDEVGGCGGWWCSTAQSHVADTNCPFSYVPSHISYVQSATHFPFASNLFCHILLHATSVTVWNVFLLYTTIRPLFE